MRQSQQKFCDILSNEVFKNTSDYWYNNRNNSRLTPPNHYFHTFFAYNDFALGEIDRANSVLKEYFSITAKDPLNSTEFNKYALIIIYEEFRDLLKNNLKQQVKESIFDGVYSVTPNTWTGNNWLFLRAICHLKLYQLNHDSPELNQFKDYANYITHMFTGTLFYDYPSKDRVKAFNQTGIPLTYSFKMLTLLIEIYQHVKANSVDIGGLNDVIYEIIQKAVPHHLSLISPDGEALYYGRSDETLFGYANILYLLYAFEQNKPVESLKQCILSNISQWSTNKNKIVKCRPYSGFKDGYIYDSVYVTYFITKIIQAKKISLLLPKMGDMPQNLCAEVENGYRIKNDNYFYFLSSKGTNIRKNAPDFCGYRYTGLTFFKYFNTRDNRSISLNKFNRNAIDGAGINIPFCPYLSIPFISFTALTFENILQKENSDYYHFNGITSSIDIIPTSKFSEKVFNKLPHLKKRLALLFLRLFGGIARSITIHKESGSIDIIDQIRWPWKTYTIPPDWELLSRHNKPKRNKKNQITAHASSINITKIIQ